MPGPRCAMLRCGTGNNPGAVESARGASTQRRRGGISYPGEAENTYGAVEPCSGDALDGLHAGEGSVDDVGGRR